MVKEKRNLVSALRGLQTYTVFQCIWLLASFSWLCLLLGYLTFSDLVKIMGYVVAILCGHQWFCSFYYCFLTFCKCYYNWNWDTWVQFFFPANMFINTVAEPSVWHYSDLWSVRWITFLYQRNHLSQGSYINYKLYLTFNWLLNHLRVHIKCSKMN